MALRPYQIIPVVRRKPTGVPLVPGASPLRVGFDQYGNPTINGMPLPTTRPADSAASSAPGSPVYNPALYGDAFLFAFPFAAAGEALVLKRPNNKRISLLIQNNLAANPVFYAFDRIAENATCILIPAGGNRLWDSSVPQGDLHIFAAAAGTVIVEYMNSDIAQAVAK